ncbi:lysophospholipid acyltransferase family protein [candidate division KSB1 bacterium]|nr:lysophospholipid acyltransferase family protein [candidate division KSB1 bacterium]
MKKFRHLLEYLFFLTMGYLTRCLPFRAALWLGARFGDFGFYCIPIRKKVTLQNLALAFPEKNASERKQIARRVYRNLGIMTIEHLRFPMLNPGDLLKMVTFEGEDILKRALAKGKGVIISGGHFGNWEIMGTAISAAGYPMSFVVADIHNRYLDKMINNHRKKMGVKIIPKGIAIRGVLNELKENRCVTLLMDQDAGKNGTFVNFFGRPASAPKGPAKYSLKTGAAIIFTLSFRDPNGLLRIVFEELPDDNLTGSQEEKIQVITQQMTCRLEARIREFPDHWFWMHRRWKTQPTTNVTAAQIPDEEFEK